LVNAKCPLARWNAILFFMEFILIQSPLAETVESGNRCPIPWIINTFPYYRSTLKRHALLS